MKDVRESTTGIMNNERLYGTTEEIQRFSGVDDAIQYFRYKNQAGDIVSPIDRESFAAIRLPVLKELSEGIKWAQNRFNLASALPRTIKRASLGTNTLGDYADALQEIRFSKGLRIEYAFSTGVHEMAHHADNIMGHPSVDIVRDACRDLRGHYSLNQINNMKAEIAASKWRDPHEVMAYSLEKYCVGKGNELAKAIAEDFLRRCKNK